MSAGATVILSGAQRSQRTPRRNSELTQRDLKARPRPLRGLRYGSASLGMTNNK
jgi:hypothetical protein